MNRLTYTHQNGSYWVMSPVDFNTDSTIAVEFFQYLVGNANSVQVASQAGLRPVSKVDKFTFYLVLII